jgi:hypothetical protein
LLTKLKFSILEHTVWPFINRQHSQDATVAIASGKEFEAIANEINRPLAAERSQHRITPEAIHKGVIDVMAAVAQDASKSLSH